MLSGESTPLLKESIQLLDGKENLVADSTHKNYVLFSGTKVLQSGSGGSTPDGGCLGVVLRTGFGTAQGELVRTMIFSTERVSANNSESFFFIGFLLIFAIAASWYVWVKGTSNHNRYNISSIDGFGKVLSGILRNPSCSWIVF
jgi:cation-transporting ATPase 13A1